MRGCSRSKDSRSAIRALAGIAASEIAASGFRIHHAVVIPEGSRAIEIADRLELGGLADREEFLRVVFDPESPKRFEVEGPRPLKLGLATSEISLSISRRTKSPSFTWGVMSSLSATSWRCTEVPMPPATLGVPAAPGTAPKEETPRAPGKGRF
jgi:hypothetical protein